ncbi:MAG TPA: LacI family transcriptional regulator [Firmicutes bacterium]|nr:LacI family transcriptional regulator [Bacillota bacterium]
MEQVANHLGVSRSTVCRVMNGAPGVKESTRQRVLKAMADLGYRPRGGRLGLESGRMIALVAGEISNPTHSEIAQAVEDVTSTLGGTLILCNTGDSPEKEARYVDLLIRRQVDGIVFISVRTDSGPTLEKVSAAGIPFIICGRMFEDRRYDLVAVDFEMGAYLATSHLAQLGHRRIGYVSGSSYIACSNERLKGYRKALEEFGIEYSEDLTVEGFYTQIGAYRAALQLLSRESRPTAVFAANDLMALGVLQAAHELGLRVPEDLAVVGFDDIPIASLFCIELTTIQHPMYELGALTARLLMEKIERGPDQPWNPQRIILPPKLVIRRTCGASMGGLRKAM